MRSLGIHVRLNSTLDDLCAYVKQLNMTALQMFVSNEQSRTLIHPTVAECRRFAHFLHNHIAHAYVHASYLINPARDILLDNHRVFTREMRLAQRLGFRAIILHPGSPDRKQSRIAGIEALARFANQVKQHYPTMLVIFENVAFKEPSIGGNFEDFNLLLQKVDDPDTVAFCIDTAHAHAYGYDFSTVHAQHDFIEHVATMIGIQRIALLHINDTNEPRGSCIDRHSLFEQGVIGEDALRTFALHKKLAHIPLIAELPVSDVAYHRQIMQKLYAWHQ